MAFTIPKENYNGKVYEVELGVGDRAIKIGGESTLPFLSFEGDMPNRPAIAIEIQDIAPDDWPETVK
ncbi:MAG: acetyl-CoA decarbonylase/synthase complex subunit delta, partial [Nitrospirae bacterium]|nr:acetyl-CoA decarbonylase/synthase complex subunit delta [Nitrospirota bacterium]